MTEPSPNLVSGAPERLIFVVEKGMTTYGRIPYKIWYDLNSTTDTGTIVNEKSPATYMITPDLGGGRSLSVFVHESVPVEFKDAVVFHEFREAELVLADGMSISEAHQQTVKETDEYAKKYLREDEYEKFIKWQSNLEFK